MTFDEWYSAQRHQLANKPVCRMIWDAAVKARDAMWEAEIESHVSAAVANEREAARRAGQSSGDPAGIQAECLSKAWEAQQHMPRERRDQGDELVRALAAAIVVTRDPGKAWAWFHEQRLSPFGGKTAAQLVEEGRAQDVIDYIESMSAGFSG